MTEVYMTLEQAEEILAAAEVGFFYGSRSQLAHARILVSAQQPRAADGYTPPASDEEKCLFCHEYDCRCSDYDR